MLPPYRLSHWDVEGKEKPPHYDLKAITKENAVGRPLIQFLKQVAGNTAADRYAAMKRMACNNSRWKAANQQKD